MKYLFLYGEYISRNYGNTLYGKGQNLSTLLKEAYDKMLDKYDVIVMPTLPYRAPKLPEKTASLTGMTINLINHCPAKPGFIPFFKKKNTHTLFIQIRSAVFFTKPSDHDQY